MDVADWLRSLGLECYEAAFRANDVDAGLLPNLSGDDLKDLGVTSPGHRRRLLDGIAALRANLVRTPHPNQVPPSQVAGPSAIDGTSASVAERRQISVMFCDIAGFTTLSSSMDPEDLGALIRGYQSCVAETIARFGGFIARYVGDGIMIYFGWPEAHEANAERAVHSGLAVIDAIGQLPVAMAPLQLRIGIATGLVIIGEPIGVGDARQQTAIGETPNLAARLQGLADPNSVVIDAATHRQVGGLFDYQDLGLVSLKGLPDSVHAWQVVDQAEIEGRFQALHAGSMTRIIGRDEELELLLRRWRQAKSGEGQLVLLSGEPGIGKSRLIAALEERLRDESHNHLRYFCAPHHQDSAFYPVISRWERDLKFARGDGAQEKFQKLEAALTRVGSSREDVALIADFLSVLVDDRYPALDLNPRRKKEKTFEALIRRLRARARQHPILMVFEDAQWADASSLDLVDKTIAQLTNLPVLLIISFRPEFQPSWVGLAIASPIALRRLTQKQAAELATRIGVERTLSPSLLERIVAQTDGVPLFIEELTKTVLEDAEQPGKTTVSVPTTLQASLIARFDRLPAAKQVAQVGAVIGREFAHALLAAVTRLPEAQLLHGLDTLVESGLAFRRGIPPDAVYMFKHALVRDAAYDTLLRSQRQELHASIGKVLEERFLEIADVQPEILAHHFTKAGLIELAIDWWRRAGMRSVTRSGHSEAAGHFEFGLNILEQLPRGEQRDERELDLTLGLAVPLSANQGFGALRVEQCALRAVELACRLNEAPSRFAAGRLAWNSCLMRHPVPRTVALAQDLISLAEQEKDPAKLALAHRALGYSLLMAGGYREADEILTRGAAIADLIAGREFRVYGENPSILCRLYCGQARLVTGFLREGILLVEEAIAHARREDSVHGLAWALGVCAYTFQMHNDPAATVQFATETIKIARDHHLPQWLALGERCLGWATLHLGDFDAGMNLQLQGIKRWNDIGARLHTTQCEIALAESYLRVGQFAQARDHLDAARAHSGNYGEVYLAAEIDRVEGLLRVSEEEAPESIEAAFAKSLNTSRQQGSRLFELRAATAFARVLAERGERRRAVDLLAPVYGWFTPESGGVDLKGAKALLEEMA